MYFFNVKVNFLRSNSSITSFTKSPDSFRESWTLLTVVLLSLNLPSTS